MKKVLVWLCVIILAVFVVCVGTICYKNSKLLQEPPELKVHLENSDEVKTAIRGGYSWTGRNGLCGRTAIQADSPHPVQFEYGEENTIEIAPEDKLIIGGGKLKEVNLYNPNSDEKLESDFSFDEMSITGIGGNEYVLEMIVEYEQGTVIYGIKLQGKGTEDSTAIVNEYMKQKDVWENGDMLEYPGGVYGKGYTFFDVNLDGTKELVVQVGGGTMCNCDTLVYGLVNGKVKEVCTQNIENYTNLGIEDFTKYEDNSGDTFYINRYINKVDVSTYIDSYERVNFIDGKYMPEFLFQQEMIYDESGDYKINSYYICFNEKEGGRKVDGEEYTNIFNEYFKDLTKIDTQYEFIIFDEWQEMTDEEKTSALLKSYNA